ncbi:MAG: FkbM family methyltransferase [Alphaproteobacteria bacterium]|nr:FkbM family methyltransferase [Alphaproteobacteria bacterium]
MNIIPTLKKAMMYLSLFGSRGLIKRVLNRLSVGSNEFDAPIPSSAKKIFLRLGTTDVEAFEHVFINDEYGFSLARQPSIIIDAGANVGMSAVYFTLRYPMAKIVAIEPEPSNFAMLEKNAQLFPQISPINAALWNREGLVHLKYSGGGLWGTQTTGCQAATGTPVPATTLQALMQKLGIRYVDLLKVDVEGAECEIFKDATPWINRVGVICAELHDRVRPGCLKVFKLATAEFPITWRRGELQCVAREGLISMPQ